MNSLVTKIANDDFVWTAVSSLLVNTRRGSNGAQMINCPMCVTRGETPDKRHRCGVTRRPNGIIIHCYNCAFKTQFKMGEGLSKNLRHFMERLGLDEREIQRINFKALQYRRILENSPEAQEIIQLDYKPNFQTVSLPKFARRFSDLAEDNTTDPDFLAVAEYIFSRGSAVASSMDFYWTPLTDNDLNRRLIIPFTFDQRIVGWTGRLIDKSDADHPKYWSSVPTNYIFNNEYLIGDNKYVPLVEGPLDAKVINGVATLGAKITDEQARWLNSSGKTIVVVADRDKAGQRFIDHALKYNWMVSFPQLKEGHGFQNWWDADIKDCAAATERYGKLYTVRSIIEAATLNKIEINVKRKLLF